MKCLFSITVALAIVLLTLAPSFAEHAGDKLARGLINSATGWGEYPKQIVETAKEHNVAVGVTWGQIKGVAMSIERTGLGVCDTGFFYLPRYDEPVLRPKTLFE